MKIGAGAILIAVGLVVLWLAVTGRLSNLTAAWGVLTGDTAPSGNAVPASGPATSSRAAQIAAALQLPFPLPSSPAIRPTV